MKAAAVIVSAGRGDRLPGEKKKQFLSLSGKPVLCHTLDKFEGCPSIDFIHLVVAPEDIDYTLKEIVEPFRYRKIGEIIPGGKLRQDSVKNGIDSLRGEVEIVVVHDGVRPFVSPRIIEDSICAAKQFKAVVVAVPVKDTIKVVRDQIVFETLDRESLWQIQTPQTFQLETLRKAFEKAKEDGFLGTDDASLVERIGVKVYILPGTYANIKITTPEDLMLAQIFLKTGLFPEKERPD